VRSDDWRFRNSARPERVAQGRQTKACVDEERKAILAFTGFLLAQGADPNIEAKENKSVPLDGAMLRGLMETVEALLDGGANPNHQDVIGSTAFSSALLKDHVEAALLLLKRGLKIDLED
jgi:ankyrin repeat protein